MFLVVCQGIGMCKFIFSLIHSTKYLLNIYEKNMFLHFLHFSKNICLHCLWLGKIYINFLK